MILSVIYILYYESESKTLSLVMKKILELNHFILHREVEISSNIYVSKETVKKHIHIYLKMKMGYFQLQGNYDEWDFAKSSTHKAYKLQDCGEEYI